MFAADDVPAAVQQRLRQLQGAPSASTLLLDIRGIRAAPAEGAGAHRASTAGSGELPISYSPPEEATPPGAQAAVTAASAPAATPAIRSAAVQRLAQIFAAGRSRSPDSRRRVPVDGTAAAAAAAAADLEAGSLTPASTVASSPEGGFTPVQQYIEHRHAGRDALAQQCMLGIDCSFDNSNTRQPHLRALCSD